MVGGRGILREGHFACPVRSAWGVSPACCKCHRGCGLRTVLALGGLGVVVLVGFRPQCVASFGLSSGEPSSIVMLGQHICCVRFVPLMCRFACFVHLCRPSLVPLRFALAFSGS